MLNPQNLFAPKRLYLALLSLSVVVLTVAASRTSLAQSCLGSIKLRVEDQSGAPVANARVWLNESESNPHSTDSEGIAEFHDVACGSNVVHASLEGLRETRATAVQIAGSEIAEATVTLMPQDAHESVDVHSTIAEIERTGSSAGGELHSDDIQDLPVASATVADALPLMPGMLRTRQGEIEIDGAAEHHGTFVINQVAATDPVTGNFSPGIPIDAVESISLLKSPFVAEYGSFSSGIVSVETRRGGDKWHAEINDPVPDFRVRSWQMVGIRTVSPRALVSGPLIAHRLYLLATLQYNLDKKAVRTLPYPVNESKQESVNSFAALDYVASPAHFVTATLHVSPQHVNFLNPDFFNPQPVTPSYAQKDYVATINDHAGFRGGVLTNLVSVQRVDATIGTQGFADMVLSPTGNSGNYFSTQHREANRWDWSETWAPNQIQGAGTHDLKLGGSLAVATSSGDFAARPIEIVDTSGELLRSISFDAGGAYQRSDVQSGAFIQDYWTVRPGLVTELGVRFDDQTVARNFRAAPRGGVSWIPFANGRTALRAGYGRFYDRVPLSVPIFSHYPARTITDYAADGSVSDTLYYANLVGRRLAPRSDTWRVQAEQRIAPWLLIQASYANTRSAGLVLLQPQLHADSNTLMLNGGGRSLYHQFEWSAHFEWKNAQQFLVSYTHSRSDGDLNEFSNFVGNVPAPLIRPNVFSKLAGDVPNRLLAWGRLNLPMQVWMLPLIEFRSGFPYTATDVLGDYAGLPNTDMTRFPHYFSADARLARDVHMHGFDKYTLRFSLSGFNLTNHFNALAVHANIADPQYGIFFGNYQRRYRADFDVLF